MLFICFHDPVVIGFNQPVFFIRRSSNMDIEALGATLVLTCDGGEVPLKEAWIGKKTVLVFIRHFG